MMKFTDENKEKWADIQKDVKTVTEIFQAVPESQRDRVRDILSGYRMGLTDGFRLCGVPPDAPPPRPAL